MAFRLVIALIGVSVATIPLSPAEVQAHRMRMISTEMLESQVEDALASKELRAAARAAKSLAPILAAEERYWDKTGLSDALSYARRNRQAAARLAEATRHGELGEASAELDAMRANCVACHGSHPENRTVTGR